MDVVLALLLHISSKFATYVCSSDDVCGVIRGFFDRSLLRLIVDVDRVFVRVNWEQFEQLLHQRQMK